MQKCYSNEPGKNELRAPGKEARSLPGLSGYIFMGRTPHSPGNAEAFSGCRPVTCSSCTQPPKLSPASGQAARPFY
ncbi:MAG: hypothetical protein ACLR0U_00865 [Enterocloster clostridioformis]